MPLCVFNYRVQLDILPQGVLLDDILGIIRNLVLFREQVRPRIGMRRQAIKR